MWLDVKNIYTKVERATEAELEWLEEYLTFKDKSAFFRKAPTDKVCLLNYSNRKNIIFPTGVLSLVQKAAPEEGHVVELADSRKVPCTPDPDADLAWLRDYQREAVDAVVAKARGILWISTGGGKTEIAIGCTRALPCNWLFIVHRSTLMDQAATRYERYSGGLRAGRIGDGHWDVPDGCTFICSTFQTLSKGLDKGDEMTLKLLQGAQGIFVDEAHTLPADTFNRVALSTVNAYYRVGLSGTPLARGDKKSLHAIATLGPVIHRVRAETLIDAGILARPKIRLIACHHRSDKPTWQGVYGSSVVRHKRRNKLIVEAAKQAEKPCLVFVKEINQGKILEKELLKAGIQTAFVYGNASLDARNTAKKSLVAGRHDVLICSVIFQEGEDIPELRSVINASGGKSVIALLQRLGRGMRVSKDKTDFEVFDIADYGCECSTWIAWDRHKGCQWLERHTKERLKAYASEGHQVTVENWIGSELDDALFE